MPIERQQMSPSLIEALLRLASQKAVEPGNIDIRRRPRVLNPDGSISTVYSRSAEDDQGRETLVPSVIPSQQGGYYTDTSKQGGPSWDYARQSGQHLGKFQTPDDADRYGEALHNAYQAGILDTPGKPNLSVNGSPIQMGTGHETAIRALLLQLMRGR